MERSWKWEKKPRCRREWCSTNLKKTQLRSLLVSRLSGVRKMYWVSGFAALIIIFMARFLAITSCGIDRTDVRIQVVISWHAWHHHCLHILSTNLFKCANAKFPSVPSAFFPPVHPKINKKNCRCLLRNKIRAECQKQSHKDDEDLVDVRKLYTGCTL